ncbi:hypothetical protein AC1031_002220 [Aphanomyces cochlioides]|nr:hypothetical protein AC1031_002220 [Aphanomyces cochlioides]
MEFDLENETWEILEDLRYVLATDDQLQDGLAKVCTLLEDNYDDSRDVPVERNELATIVLADTFPDDNHREAKPPQKKKKTRTTFEARQREELKRLREDVCTLKEKLESLQPESDAQDKVSYWKRLAQEEKLETAKAFHENKALREEIDQQATFIDQMKKVFLKKPRLMHQDLHSEEWRAYRLAATASLRRAAIHAIADRQLRRMDHAFLRTGLLDRTDDFTTAELKVEANGSVMYQLATHIKMSCSRHIISATLWGVVGGPQEAYLPWDVTEDFEQIDESTVYSRMWMPAILIDLAFECDSKAVPRTRQRYSHRKSCAG